MYMAKIEKAGDLPAFQVAQTFPATWKSAPSSEGGFCLFIKERGYTCDELNSPSLLALLHCRRDFYFRSNCFHRSRLSSTFRPI
jgi:hypothetical protein